MNENNRGWVINITKGEGKKVVEENYDETNGPTFHFMIDKDKAVLASISLQAEEGRKTYSVDNGGLYMEALSFN